MKAWPQVYRPPLPNHLKLPALQLYDSFTRETTPIETQQTFTMYVCGITPYDATHIGHAATYLTFDLLHRYLLASGVEVRFLENVTDIDDPLFERARRDSVDWRRLSSSQMLLFEADMTNLRVIPPLALVSVTESMDRIIQFINALVDAGKTYSLEENLYLDSSTVTNFGDLPMSIEEALITFQERGGDPQRVGKRHPLDPLLWKPCLSDEPSWATSWGAGRPGWHVECNAISHLLLGEMDEQLASNTISLQGGGADLLFPHHYMTSLQGRARFGEPFARHFVHAGMIRYQGEKMSKSLGNLVFISQLIKEGVRPMAIRLALMSERYGQERDWSDELLNQSNQLLDRLIALLSRDMIPNPIHLMEGVVMHLSNNLDTVGVMKLIRDFLDEAENQPREERSPGELSRFLDSILGIAL